VTASETSKISSANAPSPSNQSDKRRRSTDADSGVAERRS
jgi:hypothetical protein